jgi:D-glycero-beta-D-manno-heptose 1-phosphate adenylyltransferase
MGYVLSLEAITKVCRELGKNNKIVYTHGAFDLFHAGHLEFLRLSKEKGQILIVGIEPDDSVQVYKNIKRPIFPMDQRMDIVSKLKYVDFVFPINYKVHLQKISAFEKIHNLHSDLYNLIKPNVVTYGNLYAGLRTINETKNKLKNTKFKKIIHKYSNLQSTTKIIDKILSQKIMN